MTKTINTLALVKEFYNAFEIPYNLGEYSKELSPERAKLRLDLLEEEVAELTKAISEGDVIETVDALIDIAYIVLGTILEIGGEVLNNFDAYDKVNLIDVYKIMFVNSERNILGDYSEMYAVSSVNALNNDYEYHTSLHNLLTLIDIYRAIIVDFNTFEESNLFYKLFEEVHKSNMSKLDDDGKPIISRGVELDGQPTGKILKSKNYFKPNLLPILEQYRVANIQMKSD